MSFVDILPNGCWFWTGARSRGKGNRKWYGTFHFQGKSIRAHRFSCDVIGGKVCPPGWHRDHNCQFSLCVCPDHLEPMLREKNQELKVERMRAAVRIAVEAALDAQHAACLANDASQAKIDALVTSEWKRHQVFCPNSVHLADETDPGF